jgi:hypothetical protein
MIKEKFRKLLESGGHHVFRLKKLLEKIQKPKMVIITAPHAVLEHTNIHPFDYRARQAAQTLADAMAVKLQGENHVKVFYSDTPRKQVDLNRAEARKTLWRKDIARAVNTFLDQGYDVYVLDTHSFGNDDKDDWKGFKLIIMQDDDKNGDGLIDHLKYRFDKVKIVTAHERDDIMKTAEAAGAFSLLFEFNESEKILPQSELEDLCGVIADWVAQQVSYPGGKGV